MMPYYGVFLYRQLILEIFERHGHNPFYSADIADLPSMPQETPARGGIMRKLHGYGLISPIRRCDVHLGPYTVVGAGSVVTKSYPEGHCTLAGVPADIVRVHLNNGGDSDGR